MDGTLQDTKNPLNMVFGIQTIIKFYLTNLEIPQMSPRYSTAQPISIELLVIVLT